VDRIPRRAHEISIAAKPIDCVRGPGRALATLGSLVHGGAEQNEFAESGYSVTARREAVRILDAVQSLIVRSIIGEFVPVGGEVKHNVNTPSSDGDGISRMSATLVDPNFAGKEPAVDEQILNLIREREYRPGDRLPTEAEIAAVLSLSRQKVREGLLALESQGVVRSRQGSGRILLDRRHHTLPVLLGPGIGHSISDILDAVAVRQVLEVGFLPSAIEVIDDEALKQMALAIQGMTARAEGGKTFAAEDRAFHTALFSRMNNQLLASLLDKFWDLLATVDLEHIRHREAAEETIAHHQNILVAIQQRNSDVAQFHMLKHFYDSVESLRDLDDRTSVGARRRSIV
jgi:GntR family transcriptional regulator, transcriptional repressor for pyruvate dehydrogenase complex